MAKTSKIENKAPIANRPNKRINTITKPPVVKWLLVIWLSAIAVALLVWMTDSRLGLTLLWGFSVSLVPGILFAWYVFKYQGAHQVGVVVHSLYRAEAAKFVFTAGLFIAAFQQAEKINLVLFFFAYLAAQIISWLLIARMINQQPQ